uniref:Haloacid dehalogenase-like hydrolase n=1 Tax=Mimivirus LCMiAC02 TaxID=2506609 RepID=A0A4D5XEV0_9VIRU|nr:MAG: haloacid dehalogenase-like hydrolase [Mimivirus LCMiAC02]
MNSKDSEYIGDDDWFKKYLLKIAHYDKMMKQYNKTTYVVFDVDNTLFTKRHKVMKYMRKRGIEYLENKIKCENEKMAMKMTRLNKEYDNVFQGLSVENGIDIDITDYVDFVSEGASQHIKPTFNELHELHILFESLSKIPNLKIWTFSNGSNKHVNQVLDILKITNYFDGHINLTFIINKYKKYISKPSQKAYRIAEDEMGFNKDSDKIYFIDDYDKNIEASIKRKNWVGILVDEKGTRSVDGALRIKNIHELKNKVPKLFNSLY